MKALFGRQSVSCPSKDFQEKPRWNIVIVLQSGDKPRTESEANQAQSGHHRLDQSEAATGPSNEDLFHNLHRQRVQSVHSRVHNRKRPKVFDPVQLGQTSTRVFGKESGTDGVIFVGLAWASYFEDNWYFQVV